MSIFHDFRNIIHYTIMLDYSLLSNFDGTFSLSPIEIGCGILSHSTMQRIDQLLG